MGQKPNGKSRLKYSQDMSQKKLIVGAMALVIFGCIMAVKALWFPTIQNLWFQLDNRQLVAAPAEVVVFRETCLGSRKAGCQTAWMKNYSNNNQKPIIRYSGRNVPLQEIFPSPISAGRRTWWCLRLCPPIIMIS